MLAVYSQSFIFLFLALYGATKDPEVTTQYHYFVSEVEAWPAGRARLILKTDLASSAMPLEIRAHMQRPSRRSTSAIQLAGFSGGASVGAEPEDSTSKQAPAEDTTKTMTTPADEDDGAATLDQLKKENADLKARLDRMEKLIDGGKAPDATTETTTPQKTDTQTKTATDADMKALPGWLVEFYPWRSDGRMSDDPESAMVVENCGFDGTLGQDQPDDLKIYHFRSLFHTEVPGRYVFIMDLTCGLGHECDMTYNVDGATLLHVSGRTNTRELEGLDLRPGEHKLDFKIYMKKNWFIKFQPGTRFQWHPLVRGPQDFNPRDFSKEELFIQLPKSVNIGSRKC